VLRQRLLAEQDCQKMSIVGLGGTGKTQVALQFAYMIKETQPGWSVFWVPAVSMESFEKACAEIAYMLETSTMADEDDPKELVKARLGSGEAGRWLLIVDNADDKDVLYGTKQMEGIAEYLPKGDSGVIVYTTRTPEIAELTRGDVVKIGALERHDASDYLSMLLTNKDLSKSEAAVAELLNELACLPLAIAQAAAYLNRHDMSIETYLRLFSSAQENRVYLMSKKFYDDTRYNNSINAVITTLVASFNQLHKRHRLAADLLAFLSCVEWKAIPRSLLPPVQSDVQMEEAIGTLRRYSFIAERDSDKSNSGQDRYEMHRLVHLATGVWVRNRGVLSDELEKAVRRFVQVFLTIDNANRPQWAAYLSHARRLLGLNMGNNTPEVAMLRLLVRRCGRMESRISKAAMRKEEESARRQRTRPPIIPVHERRSIRSKRTGAGYGRVVGNDHQSKRNVGRRLPVTAGVAARARRNISSRRTGEDNGSAWTHGCCRS
jgi:hypothetical protein